MSAAPVVLIAVILAVGAVIGVGGSCPAVVVIFTAGILVWVENGYRSAGRSAGECRRVAEL